MLKVKAFDEEHEKDLEEEINRFLRQKQPVVRDIRFSVAAAEEMSGEGNVFCFSALILYED